MKIILFKKPERMRTMANELRYKVETLRAIDQKWCLVSRNKYLEAAMKVMETEESYGFTVRVIDTLTGKDEYNTLTNEFRKFQRQLRIAIAV